MKKLISILLFLISFSAFAQPSNPVINACQIFTDSATISWTAPANADSFVLQRALDNVFTSPSQLYAGVQQIFYDTTNNPNTDYYYRVKAINKASGLESGWSVKHIKTFWSPSAASQGGNRVATQADVDNTTLNPDHVINVGDYIYVGWNGAGAWCQNGVCFQWGGNLYLQTPPALASDTNKIVFIGNIGYGYAELNLVNVSGRDSNHRRIITVSGGQLRGHIKLYNAKHIRLTGAYDSTNHLGSPNYRGFDQSDWSNLYGSFGMYFQGDWRERATSLISLAGDVDDIEIDHVQAGEGGFASVVDKNDSYYAANLSVSSTGSLSVYQTTSQTSFNLPTVPSKWTPERIRITLKTVSTFNIDSIYFVGTGTTTGTYVYQAETYDGSNHATNNGSTVTLTTSSTSDPAYLDIKVPNLPAGGTFTFYVTAANTTTVTLEDHVASTPMQNIYIHDSYFPDGGSEGIYNGSTQPAPTMATKNVRIERCVYARNGGNSIQIGQLKQYGLFKNDVFILGGDEWNDEFQKFQDQQLQLSIRQNRFDFDNNMVIGANSYFNYSINTLAYDTVSTTDTANFRNNAFLNGKGWSLGFTNSNTNGKGAMNFYGNYCGRFGRYNGYNTLFTVTPTSYVVKFDNIGGGQLDGIAINNVYDTSTLSGGSFAIVGSTATLNQSGNIRQDAVPYPQFHNYMDLDSTYDLSAMEQWTNILCPQWNATNRSGTKFDSAAAAQGVPIDSAIIPRVYPKDFIVRYYGKFYKSLVNNNTGHMPTGYTDAYWKLIVFSNGSVMPIDDVRQEANSFYAQQGIGLTQTYTTQNNSQYLRVKKRGKIKLIQL